MTEKTLTDKAEKETMKIVEKIRTDKNADVLMLSVLSFVKGICIGANSVNKKIAQGYGSRRGIGGDNMKIWKNTLKLVISLLSILFAISIVYALSQYYEDMSGAVLFVGGLLIGKYLQKDGIDF